MNKRSKIFILLATAALALTGCAQNTKSSQNSTKDQTVEKSKEKPVDFQDLSDEERNNVKINFESKVNITKENNIYDNWPRAEINAMIDNQSKKEVRFNYDQFEIKNLGIESHKTGNLIVKPGEKKKISRLFSDLKNYNAAKGHVVKYVDDNLILGKINNLSNLKEYKEWIVSEKKRRGQDANSAATSGATEVYSGATENEANSSATKND